MLVPVLFTANAFEVVGSQSAVEATNRKRTDYLLDIASENIMVAAARSGACRDQAIIV